MDEEKKFILNLTRLCGPTNSITFENMLDTLTFISDNSVTEGQFIESAYLDSIFYENEIRHKHWTNICSLQDLVHRYEESKKDYGDDFLIILRQKHKNARKFLEDNGVKQKIKQLIETRKNKIEKTMEWNVIHSILELAKHYPDSNIVKTITPILPEMIKYIPSS